MKRVLIFSIAIVLGISAPVLAFLTPEAGWIVYGAEGSARHQLLATSGLTMSEDITVHGSTIEGSFRGELETSRVDIRLLGSAPLRATFVVEAQSGASLSAACRTEECPFAFEPEDPTAQYALRWRISLPPTGTPRSVKVDVWTR